MPENDETTPEENFADKVNKQYLAYLAQGFSREQATDLCCAMLMRGAI